MVIGRIANQVFHFGKHIGYMLCAFVFLAACTADTAPSQTLSAQPTASPSAPQATPTTPMPTATVDAEEQHQDRIEQVVTQTLTLAPLQPLQTDLIVDQPVVARRALTDGEQKYRIATWGPSSDWIALVPQDGPGLDIVHATTGETRSVVTDTYVLEPIWMAADALLIHRVTPQNDELVRYMIDDNSMDATVIATSAAPVRAVAASSGGTVWTTADEQLEYLTDELLSELPALPMNALVAAVAAQLDSSPLIAINPKVANLEDIQTLIIQRQPDAVRVSAISAIGEGLWLPRWSPDSTKLALTSIGGRIVTSTSDGRTRYDLGPGDSPAWSPDNQRVAYAGTSAGEEFISRDIHIVDWQGKGPRLRLTEAGEEEFYTSPSWSPDGTRIAFIEIDSGQLFVGQVPQK